MNHAPYILAAPALIYSMHRLLVVWIIVVHSVLGRYTALEVWTVRRPMRVCCGCRQGRCVLFTNIFDSLTVPCLVYNTAMYTVYGRCGRCGQWMVYTDPFKIYDWRRRLSHMQMTDSDFTLNHWLRRRRRSLVSYRPPGAPSFVPLLFRPTANHRQ